MNKDLVRRGQGEGAVLGFHVPESAREQEHPVLGSTSDFGNNGAFYLPSPEPGWRLFIIASDGLGWEHVSVHAIDRRDRSRTPNWREMCAVKRAFWDDEDAVMQLHPRRSSYVNNHQHTLHLWRPTEAEIPTPPTVMV